MSMSAGRQQGAPQLITDAADPASKDLARRRRNYLLAMGIRVVCFLGAVVWNHPLRWVLMAVAVLTPLFAVVLASQADRRHTAAPRVATKPSAPALDQGQTPSRSAIAGTK